MKERITYIYALIDPRNNECRYVGKTVNLISRFNNHCTDSLKQNTHKANWIKLLYPLKPELIVIEKVSENWIEAEEFWIKYFSFIGARLTNLTNGGEGCLGYRHTDESKKIMSKFKKGKDSSRKGVVLSEETKLKISNNVKIKMQNFEIKNKISISHKGRKHSEETKSKRSETMKAFWNTEEGKIKKKASFSEERKSKISEMFKSIIRKPHSEESKKKMSEKAKIRELKKKENNFVVSEETKLKLSIARKRNCELPVNDISW